MVLVHGDSDPNPIIYDFVHSLLFIILYFMAGGINQSIRMVQSLGHQDVIHPSHVEGVSSFHL